MAVLAGADGCNRGWVVVSHDTEDNIYDWFVVKSIDELFRGHDFPQLLAIDVPIGLRDSGPRLCDVAARKVLGSRRSSVFRAPIRSMLKAGSYERACQVGREIDGCALSKQCWGILPKIEEVDVLLRDQPTLRERVYEIHPEVSFWALSGEPMVNRKASASGKEERLELLGSLYGGAVRDGIADCRGQGAKADDVIDAFVALWSARRVYNGTAMALPPESELDRFGLRMQILA